MLKLRKEKKKKKCAQKKMNVNSQRGLEHWRDKKAEKAKRRVEKNVGLEVAAQAKGKD